MRKAPHNGHPQQPFVVLTLGVPTGLAPGFYWGTEVAYCLLSLTAKLYLGWFLLINVIFIDGSTADETLSGQGQAR